MTTSLQSGELTGLNLERELQLRDPDPKRFSHIYTSLFTHLLDRVEGPVVQSDYS